MGLRRSSNFLELESFHLRKMVQRMKTPPTDAAAAIMTVKVVLLVFARAAWGAGTEVSSAALAVAVWVKVGTTVLILPPGALVRLRVGAAAAVLDEEAELDEEEDAEEDEEDAAEEAEEEEAELDALDDEAVVEDEDDVGDELAEVALTDAEDTVGIEPASATWPRSGKPRSGNGERFFIKRFMFTLAWSRLRRGTS